MSAERTFFFLSKLFWRGDSRSELLEYKVKVDKAVTSKQKVVVWMGIHSSYEKMIQHPTN